MRKAKIILTGIFLLVTVRAVAQVDAQYSQYWALPTFYNAASAGRTDKLNLLATTRQQWIGMPDAPKTFMVCADMP